MGPESLLIVSGAIGLVILAAMLRTDEPSGQTSVSSPDLPAGWAVSALIAAMLARTAILFIMARLGMTIFEMDEAARWGLARQSATQPFFFTS